MGRSASALCHRVALALVHPDCAFRRQLTESSPCPVVQLLQRKVVTRFVSERESLTFCALKITYGVVLNVFSDVKPYSIPVQPVSQSLLMEKTRHRETKSYFSLLKRGTWHSLRHLWGACLAIAAHTEGHKPPIAQYHICRCFGYPVASQMALGDCL